VRRVRLSLSLTFDAAAPSGCSASKSAAKAAVRRSGVRPRLRAFLCADSYEHASLRARRRLAAARHGGADKRRLQAKVHCLRRIRASTGARLPIGASGRTLLTIFRKHTYQLINISGKVLYTNSDHIDEHKTAVVLLKATRVRPALHRQYSCHSTKYKLKILFG
jgi:hypothetical protein